MDFAFTLFAQFQKSKWIPANTARCDLSQIKSQAHDYPQHSLYSTADCCRGESRELEKIRLLTSKTWRVETIPYIEEQNLASLAALLAIPYIEQKTSRKPCKHGSTCGGDSSAGGTLVAKRVCLDMRTHASHPFLRLFRKWLWPACTITCI